MGARGPVRLVRANVLGIDRLESGDSGRSAARFAHRACAADDRAGRRPQRHQGVVELDDRARGDSRAETALAVRRLDRGLELERAGSAERRRLDERRLAELAQVGVPARRVLGGERHVLPRLVAPRRRARFAEREQREQAPGFRRGGQQRRQQRGELERLGREAAHLRIGAGDVVPSRAVRGVDRFEHVGDTLRPFGGLGHREADRRAADLVLGADETLRQRRRRDQERRRDARRVEPQHGLQHERGSRRASTAGCAHTNISFSRSSGNAASPAALGCAEDDLQGRHRSRFDAPVPPGVGEPAARGGQQPRLGRIGDAVDRPATQRRGECVAERVLGRGDVVRARGEERDEAPVGGARRGCGGSRGGIVRRDRHARRSRRARRRRGRPLKPASSPGAPRRRPWRRTARVPPMSERCRGRARR